MLLFRTDSVMKRKLVPAFLFFGVLISLFYWCENTQPPSYLEFSSRDRHYYEKFADACNEMYEKAPIRISDGRHLSPGSLPLSDLLIEIHASYVCITSNRVYMMVGEGRGGYGIAWQRQNSSSRGQLKTYAESLEKVLLTRD